MLQPKVVFLLKVFAFDPLMIYLERVRPEDGGWFTCVVGNSDGRSEASTYLEVRPENAYVGQPEKPSAPLKNILLRFVVTVIYD